MPQAHIFFATGEVPWGRIGRLAWRKPRLAYYALLSRLIRLSTWSDLAHVGVGGQLWVLDPALTGFKVYGLAWYLRYYPTLSHAYIVPTHRYPDHTHIIPRGRLRVWPTFLKWWSLGRWDTDDCVCITRRMLRQAGVDIPRSCYSPKKLDKWLQNKGFDRIDFRRSVSARHDSGRFCPASGQDDQAAHDHGV